ncbi:hypothetical protein AB0J63_06675 [Streptosporangium canum]|uniref:hypothetical protein n=1 Tax=Streptosporangium canum TaxID=324952 RepID=UPI003416A6E7
MKAVKRALKVGLCALAVGGALLASVPAASAAEWHWHSRYSSWVACQTNTLTQFGGWNAEHVKCEIDGTWNPFQTYSLYLYY